MERQKTTIRIVFLFGVQFEMFPHSPSTSMSESQWPLISRGARKRRDVAIRPLLVVYPYAQELL